MSLFIAPAMAQASKLQGHWSGAKMSLDITVSGTQVTVLHPTATGKTKANQGALRDPDTAAVQTPQGEMLLHAEGNTLIVDLADGKRVVLHR